MESSAAWPDRAGFPSWPAPCPPVHGNLCEPAPWNALSLGESGRLAHGLQESASRLDPCVIVLAVGAGHSAFTGTIDRSVSATYVWFGCFVDHRIVLPLLRWEAACFPVIAIARIARAPAEVCGDCRHHYACCSCAAPARKGIGVRSSRREKSDGHEGWQDGAWRGLFFPSPELSL